MTVTSGLVNNHLVFYDHEKTWRWYDAFGPNVTKWFMNPNTVALTASTTIAGHTVQAAGTSPITLVAGDDGGALLLTSGGTENNGVQFQATTEGFAFAYPWPCYFGCKIQSNDVDQVDLFVGLSITDTSAATAVDDGIFFWKIDESAVCNFVVEKNQVTSTVAAATLVDATYITLEWFFDGTTVTAYVNGTSVGSVAYSATTFPNDEYLAPMFAMLTGENSANTLQINWARAIQIREAA